MAQAFSPIRQGKDALTKYSNAKSDSEIPSDIYKRIEKLSEYEINTRIADLVLRQLSNGQYNPKRLNYKSLNGKHNCTHECDAWANHGAKRLFCNENDENNRRRTCRTSIKEHIMSRKVFISILGTGPYSECTYSHNGEPVLTSRYIQLATLKYLTEKCAADKNAWTEDDAAIFFLTTKSNDDQWVIGKARVGKETVDKTGLRDELATFKFPFQIHDIHIPDGKDVEEIWEIFDIIFKQIQENEELYFDITHAFRYLPMLLTVLINYSKFLKSATVKSITYGNFMAQEELKPIMDLTSISMLQDWTFAAGQYLDSGNVKKLVEMCKTSYPEFAEKLETAISDFHTCRGISIIESNNIGDIKSQMEEMDTSNIPPLKYVFNKIKGDFAKFAGEQNVQNGYEAAKWCFKNQLYQQAITILIETVITDICVSEKLDWQVRKNRDTASNALFIVAMSIPEKGWKVVTDTKDSDKYKAEYLLLAEEETEESMQQLESVDENIKYKSKYLKELTLYRQLVKSQRVKELVRLSSMIKEVRDDIDHAGMRSNAMPPHEMEKKLGEIFGII